VSSSILRTVRREDVRRPRQRIINEFQMRVRGLPALAVSVTSKTKMKRTLMTPTVDASLINRTQTRTVAVYNADSAARL